MANGEKRGSTHERDKEQPVYPNNECKDRQVTFSGKLNIIHVRAIIASFRKWFASSVFTAMTRGGEGELHSAWVRVFRSASITSLATLLLVVSAQYSVLSAHELVLLNSELLSEFVFGFCKNL